MNSNLSSILAWLYPQGGYRVSDPGDGGGPIIDHWDEAITGDPQPTVAEAMAQEAEWELATGGNFQVYMERLRAKKVLDVSRVEIAFAGVLADEINLLRQWLMSFKAQVAAATNLANLQTRVAALPNMPDRTLTQARNAIKDKIDTN